MCIMSRNKCRRKLSIQGATHNFRDWPPSRSKCLALLTAAWCDSPTPQSKWRPLNRGNNERGSHVICGKAFPSERGSARRALWRNSQFCCLRSWGRAFWHFHAVTVRGHSSVRNWLFAYQDEFSVNDALYLKGNDEHALEFALHLSRIFQSALNPACIQTAVYGSGCLTVVLFIIWHVRLFLHLWTKLIVKITSIVSCWPNVINLTLLNCMKF
jgi:hypothetical protein